MTPPADVHPPSLLDYVRPVLARWWIVAIVVVVATAGTYFYYESQPKVFKASTRLYTALDSAIPDADGGTSTQVDPQDAANAAALITSRATAAAVVPKLKFRTTVDSVVGSLAATTTEATTFITITATRSTGTEAAELANAAARYYIDSRSTAARVQLERYEKQQREQLRNIPRTRETLDSRTALATALRQTRLRLELPQGVTTQLDPAVVPGVPESPKPKRNALFGFVLSLLVAIGLAFALERFDRRLKRVEDAERAYGLPLLAVLPQVKTPAMLDAEGKAQVSSQFVEAFHLLRTSLQLASLDRPLRRILVTSAVPGEGKSTVARNLAISYREFGRSVTVVDADLRQPTMGPLFGVDSKVGLTTVLTGEATLEDAVLDIEVGLEGLQTLAAMAAVTATDGAPDPQAANVSGTTVDRRAGLGLLLSGGRTANPHAVLASASTAALLDRLQEQSDVVIIDSPPVLAVSDALALASDVDAVVVVTRLGLSTWEEASRAVDTLNRVPHIRIAGIVVNDLSGSGRSGYGYGEGYGTSD